MKKNKINLVSSIVFIILGTIIFVNPEMLVKVLSYVVGSLLIISGLYSIINYVVIDKKLGIVNTNQMAFGITATILGTLFIMLAGTIELLLRLTVGIWIIITGIEKIKASFFMKKDSKFYSILIVGAIMIILGLYIVFVSNIALSIIGLFMLLYGLINFISYFVYDKTSKIEDGIIEAEVIEKDN